MQGCCLQIPSFLLLLITCICLQADQGFVSQQDITAEMDGPMFFFFL